jgi:hypothetical protein
VLICLTYGLGTLAFPYALVFMPYSLGTTCMLLAFAFTLERRHSATRIFLSGFLAAATLLFDYSFIPFVISFTFFLLMKTRRLNFYFIAGLLVGALPLLTYNWMSFGSVHGGYTLMDYRLWSSELQEGDNSHKTQGLDIVSSFYSKTLQIDPRIAIQLLVYPYRGLLFYYPVLIFGIAGLYYIRKTHVYVTCMVAGMLLLGLLSICLLIFTWHGGMFFGPRLLTPLMPFLTIPAAKALNKKNLTLFIILALYSVCTNILGLQSFENSISDDGLVISRQHRVSLLEYTYNPLLKHYLPLTLENGPRSRLFENLLDFDGSIDIRDIPYSKGVLSSPYLRREHVKLASMPGYGFLVLKIPWLPLVPLGLVLAAIWQKELYAQLRPKKLRKTAIALFLLFAVFLPIFFLEFRQHILVDGWYSKERDLNGFLRYIGDNASVAVYNAEDEDAKVNIRFEVWSPTGEESLSLYLNGEKVGRYDVTSKGVIATTKLLSLMPGENIMTLSSDGGCRNPKDVQATGKSRICYSFGIRNLEFIPSKSGIYESGWYQTENDTDGDLIFMDEISELTVINKEENPKKAKLSYSVWSFSGEKGLETYVNNRSVDIFINSGKTVYRSLDLILPPGRNSIEFRSLNGCDNPTKLGIWDRDTRCISFGFRGIEID